MEAYTYKLATREKYKSFGGGALLFTSHAGTKKASLHHLVMYRS